MDRSDTLTSDVDEAGVTTHSVTSDKEAVRKAKACLWETFLVCTHLRGYTDAASTADFNMEVGQCVQAELVTSCFVLILKVKVNPVLFVGRWGTLMT